MQLVVEGLPVVVLDEVVGIEQDQFDSHNIGQDNQEAIDTLHNFAFVDSDVVFAIPNWKIISNKCKFLINFSYIISQILLIINL